MSRQKAWNRRIVSLMPVLRESSYVSMSYREKLTRGGLGDRVIGHPSLPRFSWFKHRESHILGNPLFLDQLEWLVTLLEDILWLRQGGHSSTWGPSDYENADGWQMAACLADITETLMPSISGVHIVLPKLLPQNRTLPLPWMETNYSYLKCRRSLQKEKQDWLQPMTRRFDFR